MPNISAEVKISIQTQVFLKSLSDIPSETIENGLNRVAELSVKNVKKSISLNGFVRSGELSKSINSSVKQNSLTVGATTFYAPILERGAKPHKIKRKKGFLNWQGAEHPVKTVNHPGFKGKKFLSKPINHMSDSGEIESVFTRIISDELKRVGG